ncbi:MAG: hypothetical protein KDM91_22375, partial [Verrucomicrobiae bacterium]|nr:hypothetical protein [Verrucomicrobiae bacterium]
METYRRHHSTPAPHSLCRDQNGDVSPESLEKLAYDPQDEPLIIEEINHIFDNFHIPVAFGARHRAPCPVWRSERIVLGNETLSRFANRIHVFQKKSSKFTESAESWANHGGAADSFKQTSRFFGHYMGYLSLRPIPWVKDEETRWVAVANICPPRFMNRPRYHVLTTVTGPSDGVMPFRATPYYKPIHMPQSSVGGEGARNLAVCLHASLYCALLLKSNSFHCTPVSSQDMLAILWKKTPEDGRKKKSMGVIARSGVTLNQALAVLKSGDVGAGGVLESFSVNPEGKIWQGEYQNTIMTKIEALTCITEYLSNGIPVIVGLRHLDQKINNHSALIIGMHHQSPLCEEFPLKDIEASRDL